MKVLQIIDTLRPGGAERMAVTYANALARVVGVHSFLCSTREQGGLSQTIEDRVQCLHLSKRASIDYKSIKACVRFIDKHHIQIVHAHGTSFFFAVQLKIIRPSLKIVWHNHYGAIAFQAKRKQLLIKVLSKKFDAIISVNESIHQWTQSYLKHKKAFYVQNFINTEVLNKRSSITLPGIKEKRIVCLANLKNPKGHHFLIESFHKVLQKHPEATLHLVGTDYYDAYSSTIKEYIATHSLNQNIFLYGAQNDSFSYLQESSIGVLSSSSEGLPMVLLEYANAGLAVVVTDVGQCKKVVQDYGKVVPYGDINTFAESLMLYLEDKDVKEKEGTLYKKHIFATYSESVIIPQVLKLYTSIYD